MLGTGLITARTLDGQDVSALDPQIGIYDPVSHRVDSLPQGAVWPRGRRDATAITLGSGQVVIFGGEITPTRVGGLPITAETDVYTLARAGFSFLSVGPPSYGYGDDEGTGEIARAAAALATAQVAGKSSDLVYAFGGRGGPNGLRPLDTVVEIDPMLPATPWRLLDVRLAAPRMGHTATAVKNGAATEILIFGGGSSDAPVGEVFIPGDPPQLLTLSDDGAGAGAGAGPSRRGHVAVALPDGRVLLAGGAGEDGVPLASAVLYHPSTRSFTPLLSGMRTPRLGAAAFLVGGDLVIVGGIMDAAGARAATAEIYDVATLDFVAEIPAFPRSNAQATPLPNQAVLIVGGDEGADAASARATGVVEIYQPRR
jgi:hypothetical protein